MLWYRCEIEGKAKIDDRMEGRKIKIARRDEAIEKESRCERAKGEVRVGKRMRACDGILE